MNIRFTPDTYQKLLVIAKEQNTTIPALVARLMTDYVA